MDCPKRRRDTEAAAPSGLPDDLLVEILSRVPAKSLCRFKCVSKAWRDLIADPLHRKKLPQALQGFFFDGDFEGSGARDSDGEEVLRYGFVDVLQRSVRLVDFSYLTELPGIKNKNTMLVHCCNGLLLFAVKCNGGASWSYVVCNPATKQCVAVPRSGAERNLTCYGSSLTYLLVDPGAPCHFNLLQFSEGYEETLHFYSSKTQAWSRSKSDWSCYRIAAHFPCVYVNGMLHLFSQKKNYQLTVLDVEGNVQKIIPLPCQAGRERWTLFGYIGRSQGRLHCINHEFDDEGFDGDGLFIWVLEDYERQQWVLKDTVSFSKLFGERNCHKDDMDSDFNVVGIHPDQSLVFLVRDLKLISYHMDSKEVCDLCTLEHDYECITPYVPCFSELLALGNKQ